MNVYVYNVLNVSGDFHYIVKLGVIFFSLYTFLSRKMCIYTYDIWEKNNHLLSIKCSSKGLLSVQQTLKINSKKSN